MTPLTSVVEPAEAEDGLLAKIYQTDLEILALKKRLSDLISEHAGLVSKAVNSELIYQSDKDGRNRYFLIESEMRGFSWVVIHEFVEPGGESPFSDAFFGRHKEEMLADAEVGE